MNARDKDFVILTAFSDRFGIEITTDTARIIRRAERTLHRWYELECGDGDNFKSWAIERDENSTGNEPYMCIYPHNSNKVRRYRVPDREKGAIRRINALCDRLGLYAYFQTDPRGCALYVSNQPLDQTSYTQGLACCV